MGLDVNWHGAGQLALPRETLDALLGALGECLENVRRHSGVNEADVTVTDDDRTVRAMITDAGSGFEPDTVGGGTPRLRRVGGRPPQHGGRTRAHVLVARLGDDRDARGAEAMTDRAPRSGRPEHAFRRPARSVRTVRAAGDVRESHGGRRLATGITIAAAFIVLAHLLHTIAAAAVLRPRPRSVARVDRARGGRGGSASSRDACRA